MTRAILIEQASGTTSATDFPSTALHYEYLSDLEWQAACELGPTHRLSADDARYQANCFNRANWYAQDAARLREAERHISN